MIKFDHQREERIRLPESVFCHDKTVEMLNEILVDLAEGATARVLFTRLSREKFRSLNPDLATRLDYHELSETALLGGPREERVPGKVAVITAGTSDLPVAWEAQRTLHYLGVASTLVVDVGVAGLWRLQERLPEINEHDVLIVVAGMDAALVSVVGGLTARPLIGVPTSTGYGVSSGGRTALESMLASCSPGVVVVNIDNGYGAACAAVRILQGIQPE
ncbi:MAG: nickel pincer cofactor biosynthesis protein LarB [Fidelibacterota bacterium]|nr:MAG: nickel pincer cofactor biosynthesis protein LarB [Candidatus Neomarinimicrobiota bacterium]